MKGSNGNATDGNNGQMRSSSESMIYDQSPSVPESSHRRMSDSGSHSTMFHSTRSDEVSRFPYHNDNRAPRRKKRASRTFIRSESADSEDADQSEELGTLDSRSPGSSTKERPAAGRLDCSGLERGDHMDESVASLMLQESSTFPDTFAHQSTCCNFAMEHRIFLKAVLELIAERDKVATEVGMNDPNVLKSGPLKKASHLMKGVWKVKYVEIRRGMFSYYEDAISGRHLYNSNMGSGSAELLRKNIPLEANACECRAVRLHQKALNITPRGAIFELAISGRPKRLWIANSREERQAWIQAIHDAMVGGSVTRGGNPAVQSSTAGKSGAVDSPHKEDVKKYQKVQGLLRNAKSKDDYVMALRQVYRYDLSVPVKWIVKQAEQDSKGTSSGGNGDVKGAFYEEDVKSSVDQLFKDLHRDTIKIDDQIYKGNSGHAPERIMGALARRIMLCGRRSEVSFDDDDKTSDSHRAASKYDMSESQALAYARDVLLSGNRTRSGGDSYFCVNTLCKNEDLVVLVPSSLEAEPVSITVSRDDADDVLHQDTYAKTGWLRTRRRKRNPWVKSYFVMSEGTLSFYAHALPRPHGLQGQLSILDATISIEREEQKCNIASDEKKDCFVLTIVPKDKIERQILLEGEEKMLVWAYALECTAKTKGGTPPAPFMKAIRGMMARMPKVPKVPMPTGGSGRRSSLADLGARLQLLPMDDNSFRAEVPSTAEAALKEHVANLGLDVDAMEERLANYANQQSAWVKASIKANTVYKICTLDPKGDDAEDTWAVVDATFLQEFRVTGGPNPRIMRGEEIVRVDVSKCSAIPSTVRRSSSQNERIEGVLDSPSRRAQTQMTRLLRTSSDDVEYRGKVKHKG